VQDGDQAASLAGPFQAKTLQNPGTTHPLAGSATGDPSALWPQTETGSTLWLRSNLTEVHEL